MTSPHPAWGKIDARTGESHHLAHHSADVTAVFLALLRQPAFAARAAAAAGAPLGAGQLARLAALVFLHDIGKLHPGFQAKGWEPGPWPRPKAGHLEAGWRWMMSPTAATLGGALLDMANWGVDPLLTPLFAHHGRPVRPSTFSTSDWPILPHYDWRAEEAVMGRAIRAWFPEAFEAGETLPGTPRFAHFFAGMLALADWVGSDRARFEFVAEFDAGYFAKAQDRAAKALAEIGLDVSRWRLAPQPEFANISEHAANASQAAVGAAPQGAGLLILEAETGSGKTEAALWRFAALHAAGLVEGLYFAVPTRSAAGQLQRRIDRAMRRLFRGEGPGAILAVPGQMRAGEAEGCSLPHWRVLWDDEVADGRRWAAEHATRFLAAPVAVGTIDQAMLAGLQVKHAHLRGADLARSLLVIDEVHASDAYMGTVIAPLLREHVTLGGHAMLMSATLGAGLRATLLGQKLQDQAGAEAAPYPAVWVAGEETPRDAGEGARTKDVTVALHPTMAAEAAAETAIAAAQAGARVLVIRNTVNMAQRTWEAARALDPGLVLQVAGGLALHHARFAAEDRALLDAAVEKALGKNDGAVRSVVVIGTQTLEQSLDIDADFLITDLCPMDVLLQRIGRLHRHRRIRPEGFGAARVLVLAPERGLDRLTQPAFDNGLGA